MDSAKATATSAAVAQDDVWLLVGGRGTIAGRFLHRLYAGGGAVMARRAGDAYSARDRPAAPNNKPRAVAAAPASDAATRRTDPSFPSSRARLPRSGRAADPAVAAAGALAQEALAAQHRLASLGARRSAAAIQARSAASGAGDAAAAAAAGPPMPRRPLLGEAEKARCALLMEHRGALPAAAGPGGGPDGPSSRRRRHARRLSEEEEDEDDKEEQDGGREDDSTSRAAAAGKAAARRFAELEGEVAERERFLEAMRSAGALRREHVEAVRAQVADRVAEMRRLDARLSALGGGRR